jgi:metallo-beta-lactamase family protein
MKIQFCGAATGVTGSCHWITTSTHQFLLDCGQFQGGKEQERQNFLPFPFPVEDIEFVLLSHAHIDHCGRLPLLVKRGFRGKIYCTDATADLLEVMLKDSAYIHEKEAEWKNRKNQRAGLEPVEPLYTIKDAEDALNLVSPVLYDQLIEINGHVKIVYNDAGHILGSAITEIWVEEDGKSSKIVYSGDLGVVNRPILRDPVIIKSADYLILESTYGNRLHPANATSIEQLLEIVIKTTRRGGTVVIPAFAVGRTQELLFEFNRFYEEGSKYKEELDELMIYVDSPMATTATEVFKRNAQVFDEETKDYILRGDMPLDFKNLKFTRTSEESQQLNFDRSPKVIISASGMCEAGRVRHHLKHNLWDAKSSVVFVGYQAQGTLGRAILDGIPEVKLFGDVVKVNAEIHNLQGFSGHADQAGLLSWLGGFKSKPKEIFLVHGESEVKEVFAQKIKETFGYDATIITECSSYELEHGELVSAEAIAMDAMDSNHTEELAKRVEEVHKHIENVLYQSKLLAGQKLSAKRMAELNNLLIALEKETVNLGATIADGDEAADIKIETEY